MVRALRVRLLGDLEIEGLPPASLGRRQARTLIKVLALSHGRPVATDTLVECLWRDKLPARPADQVSVLISRLRGLLGPERITRSDAGYTLKVDWLDLEAVGDYAAEAEARLGAGATGAARAAAAAGLSLVRGPLLADEPDAWWADDQRAVAERLVARLSQAAATAALAAEDWAGAADLASRVLATDPYDEVALRVLMEALARSGRPASALVAYAEARERLAEQLGVSPSAETEALHGVILREELAPHVSAGSGSAASPAALPGRSDSIALLDSILERALAGAGQVAVVEGEAGIGKTRLLGEWSRHVSGTRVISVACDSLGRVLPLQPLLDVVDHLVRVRGPEAVDAVLGPDATVLSPLLGLQAAPLASTSLAALTDPGAGLGLLFGALLSVLRRQAELEPLVVMIDDAHLADVATQTWLGQAVRKLDQSRVMIVVARRTEEAEPIVGVTTIGLGPLDLDAAAQIVGSERAADLHARSGGHPLFLVELAAAPEEGELPASITAAVADRCDRAGSAAASLRTAAVIGPQVDLDLLAAVTAETPGVLLDHLEEGLRRRLLREEGANLLFAHALIRDALAATVTASRSAFIHREAARALASRLGADPLVVARHARLGGDLVEASTMLVKAARMAVTRFDQVEALRLLDEAVELHDSAAARLERARVHSMRSNFAQAADDIAVAIARGAGPEALEVSAWSAHFQRRFDEALSLADRGALESTDADVRTSCLALGGWVSLAAGDLHGAGSRLERAMARESNDSGRLAATWLGWLRLNQGRPAETLQLIRFETGSGLAAYRFPSAYALMAGAMALAMLGRAEEALASIDALQADVERMGSHRWRPRPLNLRGWILRNLGAAGEADALNLEAVEQARAQGLAEPLANGLLDLAAGRLTAGDLDGAERLLDEASPLGEVDHAYRWRHQLRARVMRARLDLARGDNESARLGAAAVAADAEAAGTPRSSVQARLVEATAARRMGDAVEVGAVGELLARLDGLAGLEAWWITAETADEFAVDAWRRLAESRVAALAGRSGGHRDVLERSAAKLLRG